MWRRLITPAVRVGSRQRNRILLYHRVVDDGTAPLPEASITCKAFAAQLDYLARHYEVVPLEALLEGRGDRRNMVAITFDDAFEDNLRNAWPLLRERGMTATVFAVSDYVGSERRFDWAPDARILTADELRTLDGAGMRVEAHTASHARLSQLDRDATAKELGRCKDALAEMLGRDVSLLAYPYGQRADFDATTQRVACECGFTAALAAYRGVVDGATDLFAIPRIPTNENFDRFTLRLARY